VYVFVSSRTKTNGTWGLWSSPTIYTRYVSDGADGHSPYINETTNTWWEWNDTTGQFEDTGYSPVGSDGRIPYPAGYWEAKTYTRDANYAPYVQHTTAVYLLVEDSAISTDVPGISSKWKAFNNWQAVFVDSLVAAFAKIGGAVFTGDTDPSSTIKGRMISEAGVDGTSNFSSYTGDGGTWQPKLMLDFLSGRARFEDAEITGIINASSGSFSGALASPFERTKSTYTKDFSNNLIVTDSTFILPWDQLGSGRLIRLIQPNPGTSYCTAPIGKYFYEDGEQKDTLTMVGAEIIELLGYTDSQGNFTGWLVLNRGLLHTASTWGEPHRIVAHGRVKTNDPFKYHTFDGSALSTSTGGSSSRRYTLIAMPTTWFDSTDGYYVKIIANGGDSASFHTVEKNTNYTFAVYQHSLNVANGTLSPTTTFDFYFEVYSAAWLYPKSGSAGMPGEEW